MSRKFSDSGFDTDSAGFASDSSGFGRGSSVDWCGTVDDELSEEWPGLAGWELSTDNQLGGESFDDHGLGK
jgi:hypothetical protein